jgi:hypothetical protein
MGRTRGGLPDLLLRMMLEKRPNKKVNMRSTVTVTVPPPALRVYGKKRKYGQYVPMIARETSLPQ